MGGQRESFAACGFLFTMPVYMIRTLEHGEQRGFFDSTSEEGKRGVYVFTDIDLADRSAAHFANYRPVGWRVQIEEIENKAMFAATLQLQAAGGVGFVMVDVPIEESKKWLLLPIDEVIEAASDR